MRRTLTGKNNITLCLRIPKDEAIRIVGNLWARGYLSDKQYITKLQALDVNEAVKFVKNRDSITKAINRGGLVYKDKKCE